MITTTLIFTIWWVSSCITFLYFVGRAGYFISSDEKHRIRRWANNTAESYDGRAILNFFTWIAYFLLGVGLSAAGIFGIFPYFAFKLGRRKANKERRAAEAQYEALKTLAQYEKDAVARKALEKGDGAAYVDRLLTLEHNYTHSTGVG